jgi:hypothetical protein
MDSFTQFKGFEFKGIVRVKCIQCSSIEVLENMGSYMDMTEINKVLNSPDRIKFIYVPSIGIFCQKCYRERKNILLAASYGNSQALREICLKTKDNK